jgi:NADPH-ferrihemoprotein reductase
MASAFLSSPIVNGTVTDALREVVRSAAYDDMAVLALLALGGAGYLTRGSLWDKPDPYHYKWFERPQELALSDRRRKTETRNIAQKLQETKRDLVIFWGSQSGTAEGFATRLARDCHRRFRLEALVADLSNYDPESIPLIPESKFAIFITSTYGEGDPSDNSAEFCAWLRDSNGISLRHLRYMAFGLGNSNYKYYNKVVDHVVTSLNSFGAALMLPVGTADDANGTTEEDFFSWKEEVFSLFRTSLGMAEKDPEYEPCIRVVEDDSMTAIDLHMGEPVPQRNAKRSTATSSAIGALPIRETRELFTRPSTSRSCIHMELDLSQTPHIKYKTGDHVAVWPVNPNEEVARLLRVLGLEQRKDTPLSILSLDQANTKVKVPTPTNVLALLQHYLEICAPVSRETVASLVQFAPNDEIRSTLLGLGRNKEAYSTYLLSNHVTLGRLLESTNTSWRSLPL